MRALIATALLIVPASASAQASSCRITINNLDFGIYSGLNPAPRTNLGDVNVICLPGAGSGGPFRVTLSAGNSGNYLDRIMSSGTSELHYNLYADLARRRVLGDGSSGTVPFPTLRNRAFGRGRFAIFGMIPPGQRVPAGIYTDTLLIQVEF